MSNITSLSFDNLPIRTFIENTEIWFCGVDVCDILGYKNASKSINDHCKPQGITKRYTLTEKGNQELVYINEPNLYRLIIKSRKPEAERFEAWVMEEVLPTIRKTGGYGNANTEKIQRAYELSSEVAKTVANNVFTTIMQGADEDITSRWSVFTTYRDGKPVAVTHKIKDNAFIATIEELTQAIESGDVIGIKNEDITRLALACHSRIAKRLTA